MVLYFTMNKMVVTTTKLDQKTLDKLISGKILVIRVPNFVSDKLCARLSTHFLKHHEIRNYGHEIYVNGKKKVLFYGVKRIGYPFNLTYGKSSNDPIKKEYYVRALDGIRELRKVSAPFPSPIDKLRLELDELWKDGANIARFENKMMLVGMGRVINHEDIQDDESPHVDSLPPKIDLDGRFSGIIYLKVPPVGGELEVWNQFPNLSKKEKENYKFNWREKLVSPTVIRPKAGELVLINTLLPHAVKSFPNGNRVAVQSFIGYKKNKPLQLWS
ncbi:2OG-Fe(II) oxygenase [Patescibacteria group bacterium]|nr:MAG: 2OG-Fe(II) oxygenase [Patescibacteria group bacterium]